MSRKSISYYGEYSIEHWISLILTKELELPNFQRFFVWDKDKVKGLLKSINDGLFVPPVTIGRYEENSVAHSYLIDGQQRLSSIILARLNLFPKKNVEQVGDAFADDNDDDNGESDTTIVPQKWDFKSIQDEYKRGMSIEVLRDTLLKTEKYEELGISSDYNDEFLASHYMGFSYIKPLESANKQKVIFASIFRNINILGMDLSSVESRASLYWLGADRELHNFFQPSYFNNIIVNKKPIDFARTLAFIAEAEASNLDYNSIAKGYGGKYGHYEQYIEKYVYHAINDLEKSNIAKESKFTKFSTLFPNGSSIMVDRLENLKNAYENLHLEKNFDSIIKADLYIFGLVYWILFKGKNILEGKESEIKRAIQSKIASFLGDAAHKKTPSSVMRVRARIRDSIDVYRNFVQ